MATGGEMALSNTPSRRLPPGLQTPRQIVDAAGAFLLFPLNERMNQNAKRDELLEEIGGFSRVENRGNSFRACFNGLIETLLTAARVDGLNMIGCIKPT